MQSEHRVQFNPTQKSTAELREEKVDEIMNEFLPDSRYDDEMRTLVRELLVSYDDDKTSVVDQVFFENRYSTKINNAIHSTLCNFNLRSKCTLH